MTEQALVIAGHGSHRNPDSATPVHRAVEAVRKRGSFAEVRPAFWKEAPSFRNVLHTVDADEVIVVPLFVSEGYFVEQVLPREFALGERDRGEDGPTAGDDGPTAGNDGSTDGDDGPTVRYAGPVGTHSAMTDVIGARARRMLDPTPGDDEEPVAPEDAALAVVGHGTERNPNSADAVYDHVEALREESEFAEVGALFMDEPPYVEDVLDQFSADEVAVVPLFVADGFHTQDEIPELLGLTDDAATGYPVPATVEDRRIWYASAVGTDPLVVDVVLERAAEAGANLDRSTDGSRAVREEAGDAFVSWVENGTVGGGTDAADSRTRVWGELAVTATGAGEYDLRHRSDRETLAADLDKRSVGDLSELVRHAADGRYRPFAGETTLPDGWVLSGLDREELLRAVATVYPASVEHWAAERAGDLDPVDFSAVADRQTGIYDCVADCSQDEVARAIEACCGNCAKRRAWDAGDSDVEGGDGTIPCREPCSFLVAAAREFHQHEGESIADQPTDDSRLTDDSEQTADSQATADSQPTESDASVPRGDLTDPANLYRVRYRRAGDVTHTRPQP